LCFSYQGDRNVFIEYQIWSLAKKITFPKNFTPLKPVGFDPVQTSLGRVLDCTNGMIYVSLIQSRFGLSRDLRGTFLKIGFLVRKKPPIRKQPIN
jgi:hypothetical protein